MVVKIVRPHLVEDRRALRGLAEEVRLLELLRHPVIVRSFTPSPAAPLATPPSGEERLPQLRQAPEPLPGRVPPPVRALLEACLEPDPAARPSPSQLAAELELLVDALPKRPVLGRSRRTR